jgi:predicted phosphoribosyltransferase
MYASFRDRAEAGRALVAELAEYADRTDVLILALPRGGVPVAYEVARALHAPLDVFLVRKLGVPGREELAMGALASGGRVVLNREVVDGLRIPQDIIEYVIQSERDELRRRERLYRGDRPAPDVQGRTIILIDDGLATGSSMRAAVAALRQGAPTRIVVAVPVAAGSTCDELRDEVDEVVCTLTPEPFHAVGLWYEDFAQTTDEEVRELLARDDRKRTTRGNGESSSGGREQRAEQAGRPHGV